MTDIIVSILITIVAVLFFLFSRYVVSQENKALSELLIEKQAHLVTLELDTIDLGEIVRICEEHKMPKEKMNVIKDILLRSSEKLKKLSAEFERLLKDD